MNATFAKARADLRRHKLQSAVIATVIILSSAASTLALNLLIESTGPYDRAFAKANGAHLTVRYSADKVDEARLEAASRAAGVTQAAGPWPATVSQIGVAAGPMGMMTPSINVVGRERADTRVDILSMIEGRWVADSGEVVMSQRLADASGIRLGGILNTTPRAGGASLRVVGIAASIDRFADAWVVPGQVADLAAPDAGLQYLMVYRVSPAGTTDDLSAALKAITAVLPTDAVEEAHNYIMVKIEADRTSAVMIPFLLAFSGFALLAAAFIVTNVVAGVIVSGYREIGIMKAVGFTPGQVLRVLLIQVLVPVLVGCAIGVPTGMGLSQPFLRDTAHAFGLPHTFAASAPVLVAVFAIIIATSVLAALYPAHQAASMSAVGAITAGSAPAVGRGSAIARALSQLPMPRPITLGLGDTFARPLRAALTLGAILIGVSTVVFALALQGSLGKVAEAIFRDSYTQVYARRPEQMSGEQMVALLSANAGTGRFVAIGTGEVRVPGIASALPYYGYQGDSSWIGYAVIEGRWFSAPGEVVATTRLLEEAGLRVGESVQAQLNARAVTLKIVGEYFDQAGDNLLLRGDWDTLAAADPRAQPLDYEIEVKDGVDPFSYVRSLMSSARGGQLRVGTPEKASTSTPFILLKSVVAGLALVLSIIAVAGVFNTVLLNTRERVRDIAILKALGMAPDQVVRMVVASVALLGLCAGGLGVPLGLLLQRQILQLMGRIATDTRLPASFYDVLTPGTLLPLALAGVVIASLGAWLPARWAAHRRVAEVLQAE